jgi:hypothetical protein
VQLDVTVALRASEDSVPALKEELASLTAKLKECQATGASRIAELILAQSFDAPQTFDTRSIHGGDKQNRMLVQARRVWRMFRHTFLVLSIENRHPNRNWVMGRPTVHLTGGGQDLELTVVTYQVDQQELAPEAEGRVVIGFVTPQAIGPKQRLAVTLVEKDGGRRVELKDLEL